jgi:hypothetical protein
VTDARFDLALAVGIADAVPCTPRTRPSITPRRSA